MIVTGVFGSRQSDGLAVIERAIEEIGNVVAIKDDVCGAFARKLCLLAHGRVGVFAGGQKQNHLDMHPYGCDGYMSTFIKLAPTVAHDYWRAIGQNDLAEAKRIIRDIDMPYFDFVMSLTGGFDAGVHGALELFGVAQRWRRPPYYSLSDEEMERLAEFLRGLGLL